MTELKVWARKTGTVQCFGKCQITEAQVILSLGDPHYIETDHTRTHSGAELFWVFETENGNALCFRFHEITKELYVGTNGDESGCKEVIDKEIKISFIPEHGVMWT